MSARYDGEWIARLLDPARSFGGVDAAGFLEDTGLGFGMTVVDYGCGPGLLTLLAAHMVGASGKVYGLDIHEDMVLLVNSRANDAGFNNVTTFLNDGPESPLPDGVADLIICILVFHYQKAWSERQDLADDMGRLLKPGGCGVVVQWTEQVPSEDTVGLFAAAGLECDRPELLSPDQYKIKFVKPTR